MEITTPARLTGDPQARAAIVGDVGGHSHALRRLLEKLGVGFNLPPRDSVTGPEWARVDLTWPDGLVVVQAGDLIHRGPDSLGVVVLVDRLLREGRWVQVVGNHEQLYVGPKSFTWPETIPDDAIRLLRGWWAEQLMRPAALVSPTDGSTPLLVTHGGLTAGFWAHGLDAPSTAADTVTALNALTGSPVLWNPGLMLTGQPNAAAGPVWAEAGHEVYLTWLLAHDNGAVTAPFNQVHGHSSAFTWSRSRWYAPAQVRPHLRADTGRRHVRFSVGGRAITGIDPGHLQARSRVWAPLLVPDAVVS